jgi:hypothetical protein
MAQLVFEFVSDDLNGVVEAIRKVIGRAPYRCELARKFLDYEPCNSFDSAISVMRDRGGVSVVMRPKRDNIRYALVNEPHFNGTKLRSWFGTIEYTDTDYGIIWNTLLSVKTLEVACLGSEEGVEIDELEQVTKANFPWESPWLVVGAVRSDAGEWHIQRGPNYFPPRSPV